MGKAFLSVTPSEPRILLIEGKRTDHPAFYTSLARKGYSVDLVDSGNLAISFINEKRPDIVIINAASMRTSGKRICKSVHELDKHLPVILIIEAGVDSTKAMDAEVILKHPFTLQKLVNRIKLLTPPERGNLIVAGPVQFDPEKNWVRCHDRQTSLTPRLSILLKTLMDHTGEIIERAELFQKVWETTYMGDTRTMDVHISWLRQAIEEDPRHPQYIKTMRGVGYRFDTHLPKLNKLNS